MQSNLAEKLTTLYNLFKIWNYSSIESFSKTHTDSVCAFVCNVEAGIDAKYINFILNLEIISTNNVGLDEINLRKYRDIRD